MAKRYELTSVQYSMQTSVTDRNAFMDFYFPLISFHKYSDSLSIFILHLSLVSGHLLFGLRLCDFCLSIYVAVHRNSKFRKAFRKSLLISL